MGIRIGSWGLPELGATEWLGGLIGAGTTGEGGSDININRPSAGQSWADPSLYQSYNKVATPTYTPSGTPAQALQQATSLKSSGSTGGGSSNAPVSSPGQPSQPGQPADPYASLRSEIGSGWDAYINSLNDQLGGLETQRAGQEQIASSAFNQGVNTLGLQRGQGLTALGNERTALETNQAKTLRDLSENQRAAFMAGNNFLGSRGAGNSSAADQYSFALAKEGTKQRGDIMQQTAQQKQEIAQREENLNNIYNTEVNNLEQTKNAQLGQIAQWFGEAQNRIKQAQAEGSLNKAKDIQALSRDILNQAISAMNTINAETSSRRNALESWAMSNADSIGKLKANMASVSEFTSQLPQYQQIAGMPTVDSSGNINVAAGYSTGGTGKKKDIYGNVIV